MSDDGVEIIDHGYTKYRKAIKALNGCSIHFGFFGGNNVGFTKIVMTHELGGVRKSTRRQREFLKRKGVDIGNEIIIPERSFIRSSFDEGLDKIQSLCIKAFQKIEDGKEKRTVLSELGKECAGMVSEKLESGNFTPNDPFTREQKGLGKKPLEDRGALQESIDHVVVMG